MSITSATNSLNSLNGLSTGKGSFFNRVSYCEGCSNPEDLRLI